MPAPSVTRAAIREVAAAAYRVPTDAPESDATFAWDATTIVIARARAADECGIGYSYTTPAAASLINDVLSPAVRDLDAFAVPAAWHAMLDAVRNIGRPGLAATAIAAVDSAPGPEGQAAPGSTRFAARPRP